MNKLIQASNSTPPYCDNSLGRWSDGRTVREQVKNQSSLREKRSFSWLSPAKLAAFTLAEVLITLVIIGVIAAITVPALIQKTNKQEYVSKLKKSYSVLEQSLKMIALKNGYPPNNYDSLTVDLFIQGLKKTTNVLKTCNNLDGCMVPATSYKYLNNKNVTDMTTGKSVVLADGTTFTVAVTSSIGYGLSEGDVEKEILRFIVDVNGMKKPNKYGVDTFFFYIIDGKGVVPAGADNQYDCVKTKLGKTCAAKVLKEGAINYI